MQTVLIEATPWVVSTGSTTDVRLAGGGRKPYTHRSSNAWLAGVLSIPKFSAMMEFTQEGFSGGARPEFGAIEFKPGNPATLATLAAYLWDGCAIEVFTGDDEEASPTWTTLIKGYVQGVTINNGALSIVIRDASHDFDVSVCQDRFTGAGGIEGEALAKERLKRRSFGSCSNVEAFPLKASTLVFEVGDPAHPLNDITDVKDMGRSASSLVTVTWQGSIAATLTALEAASAPQGGGVIAPSIACVKWWTTPVGPLTVDLEGEVGSGYVDTAAEIAERVIETRSSVTISNAATAATWRPDTAGVHIDQPSESIAQVLDRLLRGVSLAWASDADGTIRLSQLSFSSPVETVTALDVSRQRSFKPLTRRRVGFLKNHRIHSDGEISAALRDASGDLLTAGADWATNVANRPTELTDGRVSAGLNSDGTVSSSAVIASSLDGSVVSEVVFASQTNVTATDAGAVLVSISNVTAKPSQGGVVLLLLTCDAEGQPNSGQEFVSGWAILQRSPAGAGTWTQVGSSWRMIYVGNQSQFIGYADVDAFGSAPVVSGFAELGLKESAYRNFAKIAFGSANQWIDTPPSDADFDYRVLFSKTSTPGTSTPTTHGAALASGAELQALSIKVAE